MPIPTITIGHFYRTKSWIEAYVRGSNVSVNIKRDDFENWLERTDRLDYITEVYPDHTGEAQGGECGTYTLQEYWHLPSDQIKLDIAHWIVYNDPAYTNIGAAVKKVTDQYRRAI